jgi:LPS-assembly protein
MTIFAKNSMKDENIQILAEKLDVKDNIVNASGKVVVYSLNYYITADRLIYDKINSKLELFDDVTIVKNNEIVNYSQYIFIDIKNDINNFKPMLVLDNESKLWFNAKDGKKDKDEFNLKSSTLSSCDCIDPAWSIGFSSGDFNTTKEWINTYNTVLYIKDIPVFYTPYFGFPTNDERRTGLLPPTIGYSSSEGLKYAQPIYFAPQSNYDFEYIPQVRTNRGSGHTLKYRYADSIYSDLYFEMGIFNEKTSYQDSADLTNKKHYGWDLLYQRSKLFSSNNDTDGLKIRSVNMNDVDYIDTQYNSSITDDTDEYLESNIKYFYNTNKYYADIGVNTYDDITADNNDDILQELPVINLHKYTNSFFYDYLTTSIDVNSNRKTRKDGVSGTTSEVYIPINYHTYLFDEFLNLSLSEQITYTNIDYTNSDYKNAQYGENNHVLSLYTDLIRPYDSFIHTMRLETIYTHAHQFKDSGDVFNSEDDNTSDLSPFAISETTRNITLGLNQSFYNKQTLREIVNHKISLSLIYDSSINDYEKDTLQNDIKFNYDYGYLSNRIIYDYSIRDMTSNSTIFTFTKNDYFTNLSYTFLKDESTLEEERTFSYDFGFSFGNYYKISYKEDYDLIEHNVDERELSFQIDEKCWGVNFILGDSLVASDTTTNENSYRQKVIYLEFNFKQLFQVTQEFDIDN